MAEEFVLRVHRYAFATQAAYDIVAAKDTAINTTDLKDYEPDPAKKVAFIAILDYSSTLLRSELEDGKLLANWPKYEALGGIDVYPDQKTGVTSVTGSAMLNHAKKVAGNLISGAQAFSFTELFIEKYCLMNGGRNSIMGLLASTPEGTQIMYKDLLNALVKDIHHYASAVQYLAGDVDVPAVETRRNAYVHTLDRLKLLGESTLFLQQFFANLANFRIVTTERFPIQTVFPQVEPKWGLVIASADELVRVNWTVPDPLPSWNKVLDDFLAQRIDWSESAILFDAFVEKAAFTSLMALHDEFGRATNTRDQARVTAISKIAKNCVSQLIQKIETAFGKMHAINELLGSGGGGIAVPLPDVGAPPPPAKLQYPEWDELYLSQLEDYAKQEQNILFEKNGKKFVGIPRKELEEDNKKFSDCLVILFNSALGDTPKFATDETIDPTWIVPLIYYGRSLLAQFPEGVLGSGIAGDPPSFFNGFSDVVETIKNAIVSVVGDPNNKTHLKKLIENPEVVTIADRRNGTVVKVSFFDAISSNIYPTSSGRDTVMLFDEVNKYGLTDTEKAIDIKHQVILQQPFWGYALACLFRKAFKESKIGSLEPHKTLKDANSLKQDAFSSLPSKTRQGQKDLQEAANWGQAVDLDLSDILTNGNNKQPKKSAFGW